MLRPLSPTSVHLLDGEFAAARDRNTAYLLELDTERLLHGFRKNAGLEPRGELYGGWEEASIGGHTLGHYLSACAWAGLVERVDEIVAALDECARARGDGFLGGMPDADRIFGEIRAGDIRSKGFDLNDSWVPWYNIHKVHAGLIDAFQVLGNETARALAIGFADWVIDVTASLTPEQWQTMLNCEHGGMLESLADVYGITGEARHLEIAEKFYHRAVLDPLADGTDCLPGLHGNTQIPKILGCARLYELTANPRYRAISENFWRFVIDDHSYCIGGHGSGEYFGAPRQLAARLTHTTCETCNTYNMLKLTKHLFSWDPKRSYAEYVEKALFNHILASQNPSDGMVCYFVSLLPGHFKHYSTKFDSFWCCVGTGIENHARYQEQLYFEADDTLYVNQWIASEAQWAAKNLTVRLETAFPQNTEARISVHNPDGAAYRLMLRDDSGWKVVEGTGSDEWTLQRSLDLRVEPLPDSPNKVALTAGPIVLAADLGPKPTDSDSEGEEPFDAVLPEIPVLLSTALESVDLLTWKTVASEPAEVTLVPFYRLHGRRQAVYFDTFTTEAWELQRDDYRAAEQRRHAERTQLIDTFWPGQMQPERDHHFTGEKTETGERSAWKYREARDGGYFSFTMRVLPDHPVEIFSKLGPALDNVSSVTVKIDGTAVGTVTLAPDAPKRHNDFTFAIPYALTEGKTAVTVSYHAADGGETGPLYLAKLQKDLRQPS